MKILKKIGYILLFVFLIPYQVINVFIKGFKTLSLFLSRGLYFYFEKLFALLKKITNLSFFQNAANYFKKRQEQPSHIVLVIVWFLMFVYLFDTFYVDQSTLVESLPIEDNTTEEKETVSDNKKDDNPLLSKELNLYRIYNKYKLKDINIKKLREANVDTVAWIIVEGTNINYPIVQSVTNDYYLTHSYDHSYTHNGWTFMDYRNDEFMNDQNTIFYGHNLYNGTGFGSLSNLFKSGQTNIKIMVITAEQKKYTYKVFSAYEIDPEVYYLQTNFYSDDSYKQFLDTISSRNIIGVNNKVDIDDKIITLSTCTDDNSGRKVVHAKLIKEEEI
ncbi:MAG: class B sortase [Bacilli bacterium]|nr:class B sortase [Bacilli bacterium]MBR6136663.1 class B sortase [Bacilli bacterium]